MANPIGQRIRELRLERGMSQVELARAVGTTPQNLNNIERSRQTPQPGLISRAAQALRTTTDYLHGLTDNKDIPALLCRGVLASVIGETNTPALAPTLP